MRRSASRQRRPDFLFVLVIVTVIAWLSSLAVQVGDAELSRLFGGASYSQALSPDLETSPWLDSPSFPLP